jgi:hypothetical protein
MVNYIYNRQRPLRYPYPAVCLQQQAMKTNSHAANPDIERLIQTGLLILLMFGEKLDGTHISSNVKINDHLKLVNITFDLILMTKLSDIKLGRQSTQILATPIEFILHGSQLQKNCT